MLQRYEPRKGNRRHPLQAALPRCSGESRCLLADDELPRSLRTICLQRNPGEPRITAQAESHRDPVNNLGVKAIVEG